MNPVSSRRSSAIYLLVVAYSLALAWKAAHGYLATDDPMNMGWYWRDGFWRVLWHNFTFWSTAYRPLGGLYYLPIYAVFKLNPTPYRLVILAFVVANSYLSCRAAELVSGSRAAAFLTGILSTAHGAFVVIYYNNSSIYDVLAYFLTMVILIRYITLRRQRTVPAGRQIAILIGLFILALDAKEMSVVIAGFVLAYEVIFHGGPWSRGDRTADPATASQWNGWLKREGLLPSILIVLVLIYTAGKLLGPHPLTDFDVYKVHLSRDLYTGDNLSYLNTMFYTTFFDRGWKLLLVVAALILGIALPWSSKAVRWVCFFNLTATLPISIIPPHGNNCLYIPLFGWALLGSIALVKLFDIISPDIAWPAFEISRRTVRNAFVLSAACYFVFVTVSQWRHIPAFFFKDQSRTSALIHQFEALPFRPRPNSRVLILKSPLENYAALFIAELVWGDPSVTLRMPPDLLGGPSGAQMAAFDSVITYEDGNLRVIRDRRDQ